MRGSIISDLPQGHGLKKSLPHFSTTWQISHTLIKIILSNAAPFFNDAGHLRLRFVQLIGVYLLKRRSFRSIKKFLAFFEECGVFYVVS
jgi:hypothetical protein